MSALSRRLALRASLCSCERIVRSVFCTTTEEQACVFRMQAHQPFVERVATGLIPLLERARLHMRLAASGAALGTCAWHHGHDVSFGWMLTERFTLMDALLSGEKGLATPGALLWRKGGEREESPWNAVAGP
jgi:hypothetical protein